MHSSKKLLFCALLTLFGALAKATVTTDGNPSTCIVQGIEGLCKMVCELGESGFNGNCPGTEDCCIEGAGTRCIYYLGFFKRSGICRLPGTCPPRPRTTRTRGVGLRRRRITRRPNNQFGTPCGVNTDLVCC